MYFRALWFSTLLTVAAPAQDPPEFRALLLAAARGEVDRVRSILDENPDWIARVDGDDETALHYAASHGQAAVLRLLLERGAPVDARSYNRFTPLHRAVMHGNVETVRRLLAKRPDVEARTSFGRTALQLAADRDQHALVKVLLDHGATYDLHSAAARGDIARVKELAALPATTVEFAALQSAVVRGHAEVVAALMAIPKADELGPMMMGVRLPLAFYGTAHPEVVRALVEGGADPLERGPHGPSRLAPQGSTVLHHAASLGHGATLRYLLDGPLAENPAAVDARDHLGQTPLHRAAAAGRVEIMALLAERGADLAAVDGARRSAVHLAALAGQRQGLEWLVARGVALDGVDAKGKTAVALTVANLPWDRTRAAEQMGVLELLQRLGSPIDLHAATVLGDAARLRALLARAEHEPTAALAARAVVFDRVASLEALVAAGLDPNARHEHERTLLHLAVIHDAPGCARWLLDHGGDPTLKDAHGKLARQWLSNRSSAELRATVLTGSGCN